MKKVSEGEIIPEGFSFSKTELPGGKNKYLRLMITCCGIRFYLKIENNKKYTMRLIIKDAMEYTNPLLESKSLSGREFNLVVKSFREFARFVDNGFKIT